MSLSTFVLLAGCHGTADGPSGAKTSEYFPVGGSRRAEYISEDETIGMSLTVEKIGSPETIGNFQVATFESSLSSETPTILGSVKWSSQLGEGIKIHAYSEGADGDFTTFDSPILVTSEHDLSNPGDVQTTTTNGATFTSTFVGFEDCPSPWGPDYHDCLHLSIEDGNGDNGTGPFFAGDYWLVTRYGPAWMKLTGNMERWNLIEYDWDTGG